MDLFQIVDKSLNISCNSETYHTILNNYSETELINIMSKSGTKLQYIKPEKQTVNICIAALGNLMGYCTNNKINYKYLGKIFEDINIILSYIPSRIKTDVNFILWLVTNGFYLIEMSAMNELIWNYLECLFADRYESYKSYPNPTTSTNDLNLVFDSNILVSDCTLFKLIIKWMTNKLKPRKSPGILDNDYVHNNLPVSSGTIDYSKLQSPTYVFANILNNHMMETKAPNNDSDIMDNNNDNNYDNYDNNDNNYDIDILNSDIMDINNNYDNNNDINNNDINNNDNNNDIDIMNTDISTGRKENHNINLCNTLNIFSKQYLLNLFKYDNELLYNLLFCNIDILRFIPPDLHDYYIANDILLYKWGIVSPTQVVNIAKYINPIYRTEEWSIIFADICIYNPTIIESPNGITASQYNLLYDTNAPEKHYKLRSYNYKNNVELAIGKKVIKNNKKIAIILYAAQRLLFPIPHKFYTVNTFNEAVHLNMVLINYLPYKIYKNPANIAFITQTNPVIITHLEHDNVLKMVNTIYNGNQHNNQHDDQHNNQHNNQHISNTAKWDKYDYYGFTKKDRILCDIYMPLLRRESNGIKYIYEDFRKLLYWRIIIESEIYTRLPNELWTYIIEYLYLSSLSNNKKIKYLKSQNHKNKK